MEQIDDYVRRIAGPGGEVIDLAGRDEGPVGKNGVSTGKTNYLDGKAEGLH